MEQLLEYVNTHPWLASAALLMTVVVLVNEIRLRAHGAAAIGPTEAIRLVNQGGLMLDIRSPAQYARGHIVNARNIPLEELSGKLDTLKKHRQKPIIACCDSGTTSARAAALLRRGGHEQVYRLRGGLNGWQRENLPVVVEDAKKSS